MPGTNDLLIGDVFANAARAVPHRVAAVCGDRTLTFGTLEARSNQLLVVLRSMGIGRGSRVVLWSGTELDAVPLFAALSKLGALFIPVNGLLGPDEAEEIVSRCHPHLLITDGGHTVPPGAPTSTTLGDLGALADGQSATPVDVEGVSGAAPHVAFFTSGSTGSPKGAVLSHATSYLRTHPGALLEPRGAMVCPYPLFHMGAWTIALQQWQARDAVILLDSTGAEEICDAVARHHATRINCVPAVWQRIIDHLDSSTGHPLSSIRFADTGTSETSVDFLMAIERTVPQAYLRVFYGSTEAGSVACLDHADIRRKPWSCGPPAPGVKVRIGPEGELSVSSAHLFDGYLDDPEATSACLVDGWYLTGDLADEDDDGFLRIMGRTGDLVRTGGESVAPAEVEVVLAAHPGVREVVVLGLPDPAWGEVVCAVIVTDPDAPTPTLASLRELCAGRLAPFKHPRRVEVVDSLPRTAATGQVRRGELAERLWGG